MYATVAAMLVGAFMTLIVLTNTLVVKVEGGQILNCTNHSCIKVGDTVYMVK